MDQIAADVTDPELKDALLALPALYATQKLESNEAAQDLARALGSAPVFVTPVVPTDPGDAASTDHVWLQAEHGTGWLDLDTTTQTGAPPCAASATYDVLPESMEHRFRIRLEAEQLEDGVLPEHVLWEGRAGQVQH